MVRSHNLVQTFPPINVYYCGLWFPNQQVSAPFSQKVWCMKNLFVHYRSLCKGFDMTGCQDFYLVWKENCHLAAGPRYFTVLYYDTRAQRTSRYIFELAYRVLGRYDPIRYLPVHFNPIRYVPVCISWLFYVPVRFILTCGGHIQG
jgi:hypothetical protein